MKRTIYLAFVLSAIAAAVSAQTGSVTNRFPGLSAEQAQKLRVAKKITPIPLPTWIPAGFKVEKIDMLVGSKVALQDRVLNIIYSRKLASGKVQRFSLEAGFDGIGGLPYDVTKVVPSAVGKIDLMYEPNDLDESGKLKNFVMTDWFNVGKTAFHYNGMYGATENDSSIAMISLADTEKILRSLQRF